MATDVQGKTFAVGQKVARAVKIGAVDGVEVKITEVTKVNGDKVYLDNSPQPIKFPARLAILG